MNLPGRVAAQGDDGAVERVAVPVCVLRFLGHPRRERRPVLDRCDQLACGEQESVFGRLQVDRRDEEGGTGGR
ncbi:hypothetical protein [Streptomyces sp. CC208A]|uniref:hypothetical protein n=1 Tax=Streptomyces sp. CC208A TaxID=3044573 RepID=UPI0024A95512|nr:hypothetical protein [Streptomyces sp. CC208A]